MNITEAINHCFENESNSVYCEDLNICVFSGKIGSGAKSVGDPLFLWLATTPATPFYLNSYMKNYKFKKVE